MKRSEKITAQRKAHGLSQEELADRLGVSRQAVSRWEQGSALPDANNLVQLSRTFGVTTDYLLHDDYENDQDLPPVRENQETHFRQLFAILVMLEVMVLIIQFLAVFVLQSVFFGILSFLPMVAVIGGFEYAWQKNPPARAVGTAVPAALLSGYSLAGILFPGAAVHGETGCLLSPALSLHCV